METKVCKTCKKKKTLERDFYKIGLLYFSSYCKSCSVQRYARRNLSGESLEKHRLSDRAYQKRKRKLNPRKKHLESKKYSIDNPEKIEAHKKVTRAKRKRLLIQKSCRDCERTDTHGHHPCYKSPLKVTWLCPIHHKKEHSLVDL